MAYFYVCGFFHSPLTFLRFIHVAACCVAPLYWREVFLRVSLPQVVCSFSNWWMSGLFWFEPLWLKLLWTILSRSFLWTHVFISLGFSDLGLYLSHRVGIYFTLLETPTQFPKVSVSLHTLISSAWEKKDGLDHSDKLSPPPYVDCSSMLFITEPEEVGESVCQGWEAMQL